jgi:uncharacterized protein
MSTSIATHPAMEHPADWHLFRSQSGVHLFITDGSRIYDLPTDWAKSLVGRSLAKQTALPDQLSQTLQTLTEGLPTYITPAPLAPPPLAALSLNVAQVCNMACQYCYADAGQFGGRSRQMALEVASASVDRLIADSDPTVDLVLGFMGGEPLLNRTVVHETTRYAAQAAIAANRRIRFSLTTNTTLLQPEDAALFTEFPFTVAVSIDGDRELNNRLRPMKDGSGSYDKLLAGLQILERQGRPQHLAARVTVTPTTGDLLPILDHVLDLGFDEVGFAAVLVSPNSALAFAPEDFQRFLAQMIACGQKTLQAIQAGRSYPFSNFETALQQIHRGSHRPYPCGAGAAYLSVNAEGDLFACHRLIDDPDFAMGSVRGGTDIQARTKHLARSHVDTMDPCRQCWARYLCGGGCYHEVARRGRIGCDYIRGWLDFCLQAYADLSAQHPDYFALRSVSPLDPFEE